MTGTGRENKVMKVSEVKANLNKRVHVKNRHTDSDYILTACIIRKNAEGKDFYQAEVQDLRNSRAVLIVSLEDISVGGDVNAIRTR